MYKTTAMSSILQTCVYTKYNTCELDSKNSFYVSSAFLCMKKDKTFNHKYVHRNINTVLGIYKPMMNWNEC